ncbi:hypothetical protein D9619_005154 [Psilocybe cf. subviscida]|uniref:Uncharacterized protein n=1 Tax=Psilocybe cf. subviscida TaxID=2480587 RepID=A0A8H5BQ73_9AGAR|nr:hypothetical protein D9619_005154 [Psilocybe cf. subviscida]
MFSVKAVMSLLAVSVLGAMAETHTVRLVNNCGFGTPTLVKGSSVLSTGAEVTSSGPLINAIAYLQTGGCGTFNGAGCTVVETTLRNPTSTGNGSFTEISLISP